MLSETILRIFSNGLSTAIPEGALTVSKWAAKYRFVSNERSARPGLWKNEVVPFLSGIMDAVSEPGIKKIVFQKSSQVGGSELLNNIIGYFIHIDPAPMLMVIENELKAQAWSKESFAPMLRDTPALAALVAEARERDSSNTIQLKMFRGGYLATAWATSPATLSSRPIRILLLDEVDAFEPTKEGDPVKLAEARQKTFSDNKKEILVSSPRLKETSVIEREYLASDQRKYFVPCPDCGEFQVLKWEGVKWDDDRAADAFYVCLACGVQIENSSKHEMLLRGEWRATNASPESAGVAGFWINEIYSPFTTWGDMAQNFLSAKKHKSSLQTFVNTALGETWEERDEEVSLDDYAFLRETYDFAVPPGALVLTAGVDVQKDRLEVETVGWGINDESWSIDYTVIEGDPNLTDVWDSLSDYLQQEWTGKTDKFKIKAACIDSGGHHTKQVYRFAKANSGRRWFAVKGANTTGKPLVSRPSIVGQNRVRLYTVGTDTAKENIHSCLRRTIEINKLLNDPNNDFSDKEESFAGYCHFPADREESYFKQFFAEKQITKFTGGVAKKVWVKISAAARNEALDLRVYASAALGILNTDLEKLAARAATRAQSAKPVSQKAESELYLPDEPLRSQQAVAKKRRFGNQSARAGSGNFVTSW